VLYLKYKGENLMPVMKLNYNYMYRGSSAANE